MRWIRKGLIFKPDNHYDWMITHAQVPIVDRVNDEILRVYFSTRDKYNRSVTAYIEVQADNPQNVLYIHDKPVLGLGDLGCFDDSGAMPCWIVNYAGAKYLFYTGWNVCTTVSYRLSIGLAISNDNGQTFSRLYRGPIMDRTYSEPQFCAGPCVIVENGIWKMWYLSCTKWEIINEHPEPFYNVKYADSSDGIHWKRTGQVCIDHDPFTDAINRPCVVLENGVYRMFFSYRNAKDYRIDPRRSYRLGYAESADGINWVRKDDEMGVDRPETGWDSEMMCYCYVYEHKGKKYMIYNGNKFGKSGFGYAILDEP